MPKNCIKQKKFDDFFKMVFFRKLEILQVLREKSSNYWSSQAYLVYDPDSLQKFVYKTRELFPEELVEIERVLSKLITLESNHLCQIVSYNIRNHTLDLLLGYVDGNSLDHNHDNSWNNEPEFRNFLSRLSTDNKIYFSIQLLELLAELHNQGLLYQDLKIEHTILSVNNHLIMIDIDAIVLMNGYCAKKQRWLSPAVTPLLPYCCVTNDLYQAGHLIYEIFTGSHMRWNRKRLIPREINKIILRLTSAEGYNSYSTAEEALSDFYRIS